jgi:hypothetical protein
MTIIDIERPPVTDDDGPSTVAQPPAPLPAATIDAPRRPLFGDLGGPLSRSWGFVLMAAWVLVIAVGLAVEPAPADPDAPVPLVADLLSMGLLTAWGAMAAGVFQRRRFAAAASLVAGVGLLALTLGCPVSGHHGGIGAWWGVQMAGAVGLLALSGRALRSPS